MELGAKSHQDLGEGHSSQTEGDGSTHPASEGQAGEMGGRLPLQQRRGEEEPEAQEEHEDEDKEDKKEEKEEGEAKEELQYLYGWDPEHLKAWRMDPMKAGSREFASKLVTPEHAADDDEVMGVWPDGHTAAVSGLLVVDFLEMNKVAQSKKYKSPYYHGRLEDGRLISVKDRSNGGVKFICIATAEGQLGQCKMDALGGLEGTVDALVEVAKKYEKGELQKMEIKKAIPDKKNAFSQALKDEKAKPLDKLDACGAHHRAEEKPGEGEPQAMASASAVEERPPTVARRWQPKSEEPQQAVAAPPRPGGRSHSRPWTATPRSSLMRMMRTLFHPAGLTRHPSSSEFWAICVVALLSKCAQDHIAPYL